jgi:predicted DNA-binding transcriptional regulator AlpA
VNVCTKYDIELIVGRHMTDNSQDIDPLQVFTESDKAFLNVVEAAELLGVSPRTIKRWQAADKMPQRTKCWHRWVYRTSDILAMIAAKAGSAQP